MTCAAVLDLIADMHEQTGATVLIATHDQAVAARSGTAIAIRDGRLVGEAAS